MFKPAPCLVNRLVGEYLRDYLRRRRPAPSLQTDDNEADVVIVLKHCLSPFKKVHKKTEQRVTALLPGDSPEWKKARASENKHETYYITLMTLRRPFIIEANKLCSTLQLH